MSRPHPALRYLMPAIAGYEPGTTGTWYHDVTSVAVTFRTHPEAVAALLPDRFSVDAGADLEYATVFPTEQVYDRAEGGAGRVRFFPSTFERNPTHWRVVFSRARDRARSSGRRRAERDKNLLCQLEPLEYRSALLTHGKTRLFAGRARALR